MARTEDDAGTFEKPKDDTGTVEEPKDDPGTVESQRTTLAPLTSIGRAADDEDPEFVPHMITQFVFGLTFSPQFVLPPS